MLSYYAWVSSLPFKGVWEHCDCCCLSAPRWNAARAECLQRQLQRSPHDPMLILVDFKLQMSFPGFLAVYQCDTRNRKITDKYYGNTKDAYIAWAKPLLSDSEYNTVQLIPIDPPVIDNDEKVFKSGPPTAVKLWRGFTWAKARTLPMILIQRSPPSLDWQYPWYPKKTIKLYPNQKAIRIVWNARGLPSGNLSKCN